ncbi:MAG: protein kinase [Planctomycetales bacterium]|nr:protein kinase [Planctomycetales bacterium]
MHDNEYVEDLLDDLLAEWELARQSGSERTAEQLCADHPELTGQLQRKIDLLRRTSWVMEVESVNDVQADGGRVPDDTQLAETDVTVSEFVDQAKQKGLLTDEQLKTVSRFLEDKALDQNDNETAKELAERLVRDNALTAYQARVILQRGNSPLLLDRYIILDTIGSGGMGLVFKAFHRSMERTVALKVLPEFAVDSKEKVARFQREIRAAAKLSHPNVVTALDAHESNGTHFLVMEYVDGKNLHDCVQANGPFSAADAKQIVLQVAAGLGEAHHRGIIHRDVKPTNVMLTSDGVAKLLDLGLSRMRHTQTGAASELTQDGLAMGTIAYMSPEQAFDAKTADARSDIYSLGCTLYFLLSGRPLFERDTAVQTIFAHREEAPPSLRDACSDVDEHLEHAYQKMIAKEPAERYQSIDELLNDLGGDRLDRVTSLARPMSTAAEKAQPRRRATDLAGSSERWPFVLAAICVVAIAVWAAAAFLSSTRSSTRDIVKWILSSGGEVTAVTEFGETVFTSASSIPDGDFTVVGVHAVGNVTREQLHALQSMPELKSLTISAYPLLPVDDASISDAMFLTDIRPLTDTDLELIGSLSKLESLSIYSDSKITAAGMDHIAKLPELTELTLEDVGISEGLFDPLKSMPKLTSVYLSECKVDADCLAHLPVQLTRLHLVACKLKGNLSSQLTRFKSLRVLDLDETRIESSWLESIAAMPTIQDLYLCYADVSGTSLDSLSKLPNLEMLDISYCKIDSATIDAVLHCRSLEMLDINSTDLNDEMFIRLASLSDLQSIDVFETNVTNNGVDRFAELNPDCDVFSEHIPGSE